jgi:hypothetical protein
MDPNLHRLIGIYVNRADAGSARESLVYAGLPRSQVKLLAPGDRAASCASRDEGDDVLDEVFRVGAIGTVLGTVAGAAGTLALTVSGASLFVASPILGTLVMLGWGASTGDTPGAAVGVGTDQGDVSDLIRDALNHGSFVLVAYATTEAQTTLAQNLLGESMTAAATVTE